MPADELVVTTWHDDEPLEDVFFFVEHVASVEDHPDAPVLVLHIARSDREREFVALYDHA